jgi:hypothetical protein
MWHPLWREDVFVCYEYACLFVKYAFRTYNVLLKILPSAPHTSPLSVHALQSKSCLSYNDSVVIWTVVSLTYASVWVWIWVLCYDRRSVGHCVLEWSTHLGLTTRFLLLSDSCGFVDVGRSVALSGLSFTIAAVPRQLCHSLVRDPWDSRPYFTLSDSTFACLSPPTTRRATVEVFDPTSTRDLLYFLNQSHCCYCGPHRRHHVEVLCCPVGCRGNLVFSNLLLGNDS